MSNVHKKCGKCECGGITRFDEHGAVICEECNLVKYQPGYNSTTTIYRKNNIEIKPSYQVRIDHIKLSMMRGIYNTDIVI